jgi:RHS repeat-associated protein
MGYTLKQSSTTEQDIAYGYAADGRFNALTADGTAFSYAYTTNSHLISGITQSGASWTQTNTYLSNRDLLDVIETKISSATKAKFDYAYDNLGRRTGVAKTGEVYSRYSASGLDTTWGYDDRNEITSEVSKLGGTSTVLTGRDDAYAFDNIGNRASTAGTTHNSNAAAYTSNSLNQYTQRVIPGVIDVAGLAPAAATVTVNASASGVTRHNDYYFKGLTVTNSAATLWQSVAVASSLGGSDTRNAFVAQTQEAFTYDYDGNLLTNGRWTRTYDAENRLIAMETVSAAYGAGAPRQKLEFKYDAFSRRVGKKLSHYASGWVLDYEHRFVYDGWNMIEELNVSGGTITKLRTFAWGLDLSGSRQGAGGVGGLLLVQEAGSTYFPAFDGNGNVHGLIKSSDGSLAAMYEYDGFGNTLRESGTYAASNPFRFSTKFADAETGEVNYGLRIYSPTLGRFITRDPIEEQGGLNPYAFVTNNGINKWDLLGMRVECRDVDRSVFHEGGVVVIARTQCFEVPDFGRPRIDVGFEPPVTFVLPPAVPIKEKNATRTPDKIGDKLRAYLDCMAKVEADYKATNDYLNGFHDRATSLIASSNDELYDELIKVGKGVTVGIVVGAAVAATVEYTGPMLLVRAGLSTTGTTAVVAKGAYGLALGSAGTYATTVYANDPMTRGRDLFMGNASSVVDTVTENKAGLWGQTVGLVNGTFDAFSAIRGNMDKFQNELRAMTDQRNDIQKNLKPNYEAGKSNCDKLLK